MKHETESVISSICAADDTIKKSDFIAAMSLLRGDKSNDGKEYDTTLTRAEAANILRVSRATITAWAKSGIITRFAVKGRKKALGYSRRSVMAILNGKAEGV